MKSTPEHIKLDEKNHVKEPFLAQLEGLGWTVIRLEQRQSPQDSYRENFAEVVLHPRLRESLEKINPWLEPDQVYEVVKRITTYSGTGLLAGTSNLASGLVMKVIFCGIYDL